jgi:hypothetical protein
MDMHIKVKVSLNFMNNKELITNDDFIKNKIHTIRGKQVILDRDNAVLYGSDTRSLKQAVKRNIERFPNNFMFKLNEFEIEMMVSQNVIPSKKYFGGSLPYAFTEQGVAMLSSILNSKKAVEISIKIMNTFISMRKFLIQNSYLFQRMDNFEVKLVEHDKKIDILFNKIQDDVVPKQGIFFDGQVFDAYVFVSKLIKKAKEEIILVDNYIDEEILEIFTKTKVNVKIYTKNALNLDIQKLNKQYKNIEIKLFDKSHDRFLIIDNEAYHLGASLKDLGKKWFAFSLIKDKEIFNKLS